MPDKKEYPIIAFENPLAFEQWLAEHHAVENGIWLRFYKKDSGVATITYAQALDEALCYGWIDGQAKKYDDTSWLQKFTPRRPRSIWSKRNREYVERLIKAGKMQTAGLRQIEVAKADGRWDKAYDSPSNMEVPEDFLQALAKNEKANAFFETLNKTNTYAIAWRLQTAKRPETRERRMNAILEMLAKGEKFH
jgi:uncharacterized protein YdeI (YjbR/CyaY-like superfamily)